MKRAGVVFGLLGIVLVTALWYMFCMRPINAHIADTETQLQTERDTEVVLRTRLASLKTIQDNELSYISAIGAMDAQIPPTPQMPGLIDDLDVLADETGVDWLGSTIGSPAQVENQDYFEIPISIRIEGQFFEVLGYLYGMADLERLVRIDGIAAIPNDLDGFTMLDVTITAKAFTTSDLMTEEVGDTTTTTTPDGGG
ncbi:MAG: type 4a pilus biogenesis protein PilO [Gammaproteobacteria bacterium]|nr:type 4a pilus biogenesis protein PilO [Gammaproteobacteria bacterium]